LAGVPGGFGRGWVRLGVGVLGGGWVCWLGCGFGVRLGWVVPRWLGVAGCWVCWVGASVCWLGFGWVGLEFRWAGCWVRVWRLVAVLGDSVVVWSACWVVRWWLVWLSVGCAGWGGWV
jgi:hypothetical protein